MARVEPSVGEGGNGVFMFSARTSGEEGQELLQVKELASDPGTLEKEGLPKQGLETTECQGMDHEFATDWLR